LNHYQVQKISSWAVNMCFKLNYSSTFSHYYLIVVGSETA